MVVRKIGRKEQIFLVVKRRGKVTRAEIAEEIGVARITVSKYLSQLVREGAVYPSSGRYGGYSVDPVPRREPDLVKLITRVVGKGNRPVTAAEVARELGLSRVRAGELLRQDSRLGSLPGPGAGFFVKPTKFYHSPLQFFEANPHGRFRVDWIAAHVGKSVDETKRRLSEIDLFVRKVGELWEWAWDERKADVEGRARGDKGARTRRARRGE